MMDGLYQATSSYYTVGFTVVDGRIKRAPSIIKWARGKKLEKILGYFSRKLIKVEYLGE